ncbi:RNA-guided endonuclease InsQ/TnpB family protein [Actinomadura opuntiae]|uniref:RNA-guided endonuclease InsQ/TnpB family protein n=1 Tax=Actinomadura sp. OS1-43 TaxID=604315 RepID=UPI00255A9E03|nr:transposase [Actinomadura sp. OS1-43]MDL4818355.1 transposase [Actinomadura sp. OS1-43]
MKEIRAFDPGRQGRWSFSSQQATLRRLNRAFEAFFRRVKIGQMPGYPRFKGAGHFDTVEFPRDGDGCRWDSTPNDARTRVRLQGVGHIRVHQHRSVRGRVKTISVKREGRRWFVVVACVDVPTERLAVAGSAVGIDMGVAQRHLATFPKRTRQRTKRHRAAARKVAKLYARIRRQRLDHHHKTALKLVREHDAIACERLNIAGMTRAPASRPAVGQAGVFLPNGAAGKAGLNKSILGAGWGLFLGILADKAESAGRRVIPVDARDTSRTCPPSAGGCGHVARENRLTQARLECVACGFTANADHAGALNVLHRAGLARCPAA